MKKKQFKQIMGFSLAEAMITLLIVCIIAIASAPVITKRHKLRTNIPHGAYACYWNGDNLVAKYIINGKESDGHVVYDAEEGRYGCEFNPQAGSKNFVATVIGGGGGGAGSGTIINGSDIIKTYPEVGDYVYTTPESGLYSFLAVGGGGGGGGMWGSMPEKMAGTGSTGGLVYAPYTFLGKGTALSVKVGNGGAGVDDGMGGNGSESFIKNTDTGTNYAVAEGGGGGAGWRLRWNITMNCDDSSYIIGYAAGTFISGYPISWNGKNLTSTMGLNPQTNLPYCPSKYINVFRNVKSGFAGGGSSDIKGAKIISGRRLDVLNSADHQNHKNPYNLIPQLTDYNGQYGFEFNSLSVHPVKRIATTLGAPKCKNSGGWQNFRECKVYTNHYGAGGGGEGDNGDHYYTANNGAQGFAAIKFRPMYAGLGGESGSIAQIPYADMPQKTLLFPGKGGEGGSATYYMNIANEAKATAGTRGENSYIKNGSQILGGPGGPRIIPGDQSTYSALKNDENMPIGGDGKLSDVLTSKKIGTGGLGGLSDINTTINGLTQTVFENGAAVGGFTKIYGAGAGGGGATAALNDSGSFAFGNGGQGTSGLVFIQW